MNSQVMVSIWCVTYNHKRYIKDAIEGFLRQKTTFDYHIIIHDDASTDGTSDIVREYATRYPDKITAIIQEENLYSKHLEAGRGRVPFMKKYVTGKYLACCEGDDYWTDPYKLQLQIEYMETHPECVMTSHDAMAIKSDGDNCSLLCPYEKEKDLDIDEVIMWYRGNLPSAAAVFRKDVLYRKGIFDNSCPSGDWVQQLYCMTKGKIHYFNKVMSNYRVGTPGSYTVTEWDDVKKRISIRVSQIIFLITYDNYMKEGYHNIITQKINQTIEYLVADANNLSNEEIINIFYDLDYFHENMTNIQHEEYKEYIFQIRDVILAYKDDYYCSQRALDIISKSKNKNVYIYGAGYFGRKMFSKLFHAGIEVNGFIVSTGQHHKDTLNEIRIYELHEISNKLQDSCVVLAVNLNLQDEIKKSICMINNVKVIDIYGLDFS